MAIADHIRAPAETARGQGDWLYWSGWARLAKWGGFLLIGLIYFPLFWLALMSISERPLSGIPFPISFENYGALLEDRAVDAALRRKPRAGDRSSALVCAVVATFVGRAIPHRSRPRHRRPSRAAAALRAGHVDGRGAVHLSALVPRIQARLLVDVPRPPRLGDALLAPDRARAHDPLRSPPRARRPPISARRNGGFLGHRISRSCARRSSAPASSGSCFPSTRCSARSSCAAPRRRCRSGTGSWPRRSSRRCRSSSRWRRSCSPSCCRCWRACSGCSSPGWTGADQPRAARGPAATTSFRRGIKEWAAVEMSSMIACRTPAASPPSSAATMRKWYSFACGR